MNRTTLVGLGFVLLIACAQAGLGEPETRPATQPAEEFGKAAVVMVERKSDRTSSVVLEGLTWQRRGSTTFLVGRQVDLGARGWVDGLRIWIPEHDLAVLYEFEGVEDYKARMIRAHQAGPPQPAPPADGL